MIEMDDTDRFAFIKPGVDAHTLGINSVAELLRGSGYQVFIAEESIERAMNDYRHEIKRQIVMDWIKDNRITGVGISYRLDPLDAANLMGYFIEELKRNHMLHYQGGPIRSIFFAGLPEACNNIQREFKELVTTFQGGESAGETLASLGVPKEKIPKDVAEGSSYDEFRMEFGKDIIQKEEYQLVTPSDKSGYPEYGTAFDSITKRIDFQRKKKGRPLIRAHVGPYSSDAGRKESVDEFISWTKLLADAGYLDILSIGSSQLTQSNFGEDWKDSPNGGGVPVNSAEEYRSIWAAARPMLVRTYAGTKNIPELAKIHEENLHICWHALSFWWFNQLDERGPYELYENLKQHVNTLKYIAGTKKPFEPNVPHHFSFRGADDVTVIVSAFLSAKLAKKMGINTLILQNMLNTPKSTWGIQDLAKSRAMIRLINELEDVNFRVFLQPRAGLDYFKTDMNEARIQLASVTALMDDIDPHNEISPPVIHVVSYSEASHLATPDIINESIKITLHSLNKYRELRKQGNVEDMGRNQEIQDRMNELISSAKKIISFIEKSVRDPYSAEGFYRIFAAGFLPVPYLWDKSDEFKHAKAWKTKSLKGMMKIVDKDDRLVSAEELAEYAKENLREIEGNLPRPV